MKIYSEISVGELIDKISILNIKSRMIKDDKKLKEISKELNILMEHAKPLDNLNRWLTAIESVNSKLWEIEDAIRLKEKHQIFDQEFIDLARSVYITNDERFNIKNSINTNFHSNITEQKSYEKYN